MDLTEIPKRSDAAAEFCEEFFLAQTSNRWLFGVNEYSTMLSKHVNVAGFIDDFCDRAEVAGLPVIGLEEVPPSAMVVSTLLGRPLTGKRLLDDRSIRNLDFFGFYEHCELDLPEVRFWGAQRTDYEEHPNEYAWVMDALADRESREVFLKLMSLRLSGDLQHHQGFTDRQDQQYFEDFIEFRPKTEVFVDIGAYDGVTSLEFIKRCPDYKAVYAFEPESENADRVVDALKGHDRVQVIVKGLAEKSGSARMSPAGSASSIDEGGTEHIELARLDDCIEEPPTFLKLDIEGAESGALAGASECIARHRPLIAVAVYHKPSDLWRIPRQILSICPDYEIRLRHYTEGVVETVMYFVPTGTT